MWPVYSLVTDLHDTLCGMARRRANTYWHFPVTGGSGLKAWAWHGLEQ